MSRIVYHLSKGDYKRYKESLPKSIRYVSTKVPYEHVMFRRVIVTPEVGGLGLVDLVDARDFLKVLDGEWEKEVERESRRPRGERGLGEQE